MSPAEGNVHLLRPTRPPLHRSLRCSVEHIFPRLNLPPCNERNSARRKFPASSPSSRNGACTPLASSPLFSRTISPPGSDRKRSGSGNRRAENRPAFCDSLGQRKFFSNKSSSSTKSKPPSRSSLSCNAFSNNSPAGSVPFTSSPPNSPSASLLPIKRPTSIVSRFPIRPTRSNSSSASSRHTWKISGPTIRSWRWPSKCNQPGRASSSFNFSKRRCAIRPGCTKPSLVSRDC